MKINYLNLSVLTASAILTACPVDREPDALDCMAPGESYRAKYVVKSSTCWEGDSTAVELSGTIPHKSERLVSNVKILRGEPRDFKAVAHSNWHGCAVSLTDVVTGVTCELSSAPIGLDGEPFGPCLKDGKEAGCEFHMDFDYPPRENASTTSDTQPADELATSQ